VLSVDGVQVSLYPFPATNLTHYNLRVSERLLHHFLQCHLLSEELRNSISIELVERQTVGLALFLKVTVK